MKSFRRRRIVSIWSDVEVRRCIQLDPSTTTNHANRTSSVACVYTPWSFLLTDQGSAMANCYKFRHISQCCCHWGKFFSSKIFHDPRWQFYRFFVLLLALFFSSIFCVCVCVYVILSVTTAVNIFCVLTMGGRLRWLWLSGSPPLIFLLCVLLIVESVYGK